MFIIYSKQTGNIITATQSDLYKTIEDMYPMSYVDYEIIYDCLNAPTDDTVLRNTADYKIDLDTKEIVPVGKKQYTIEELIALGLITQKDLKRIQ